MLFSLLFVSLLLGAFVPPSVLAHITMPELEALETSSNQTREGRYFGFLSYKDNSDADTCMDGSNTGVCTSSSRCKSKGGRSSSGGNCPSNKICCQITATCPKSLTDPCIISTSGTTIVNENGNSDYRRLYRFKKPKGACQLRLDFDLFDIAQPDVKSDCSIDSMQVVGSNLRGFGICGINTGQHMYLNYGKSGNTIDVSIRVRSNAARYSIRATFIGCNSDKRAPTDCLQYFTTLEGTVKSFNFDGGEQTNNLGYSVCVEAGEGMNAIQWSECTDTLPINPFFISGDAMITGSEVGTACTRDWVQIYGDNRYCGRGFPGVRSDAKPFLLDVNFDRAEGVSVNLPTNANDCNPTKVIQDPDLDGYWICAVNTPPAIDCTCTFNPNPIPDPMNPDATLPPPLGPPSIDIGNTGFCLNYMQLSQ